MHPNSQTLRFCLYCRSNLLGDEASQCYVTIQRPQVLRFRSINLPRHNGNNVYSKPSLIRLQFIRIEI
jgi:hypothetical protein